MRKLLALSIVLLLHITASVAQGSWTFAAPSDGSGSAGPENARAICTDASGNVYIVGNYNGSGVPTDFNLNSSFTNTATATSVDGFIASYDKNGNFRWKTTVSGTGIDFGAPAGGVCTNGTFVWMTGTANVSVGAAQIMSSTNTVTITSPGTGVDAFIAKLNCSNGSVVWQQGFGGSGVNDIAQGVCVDPSGCAYVVGAYSSAFTLGSVSFPAPGGTSDLFIAKFTPGGVLRAVLTGGSTTSNDMIANGGGICYVPGAPAALVVTGHSSASTANYGAFTGLGNFGLNDAMLAETDTALGAFTNALVMGSSAADELLGVVYDPTSGGVFVSGYCSGNITFPGTAGLTALGAQDIVIARYSVAANNFVWSSIAGGTGNDRGWSLAADGVGGIFLSGHTASAPCTFSGSVSIPTNAGLNDVYVTRYSAAGVPAWTLSAGGTGSEEARSISSYIETTPYSQSLFITGITTGAGLNFGASPVGNDGGSDFYIAKINDAAIPLTATQSQVNLTCNSVCNGSATVVASGGVSPYTYSWSPSGGTAATASSLCAGSYTCTITDAASASITRTFNITQPTAIVLNANTQTNISCFGGNNGAASVVPATGGAGGYTYNWTPGNPTGDGTVSVTGLIAGTWTCTVTDANSCTTTRTFNITQPSAISVTPASLTNISCNGGNNGAASINTPTGGAGGYTYNWTPGNPTGDGTVSVTGLTAQIYTCTVTDANSCTATQTFNITQPTALVVTQASQTNVSCFGGNNGAASINTPTGGAGGYTYNWTPGNPTGDGTVSVTGLTAGSWTCTVTDANSCTATRTFSITAPTALVVTPASQTNVSCFGGNNGAASINTPTGGAGGYTYNWTPGNPTGDGTVSVTGLTAGSWTCTVTDANSCTATQTFNITSPTAIVVTPASQTNISCFGGSNGAASINTPTGGAGGYTYNWTPGNPTGDGTVSVTGLTAGSWTCTVTDANSCTATQTFNITSPTAIVVTPASQTNISCFGGSNGAASINTPTGGAGGYTYNWTPGNPTGDGTVSVTGLTAGSWTCTVTDANSCTATQTFNITQPGALVASALSQTNISCFGGSNGAASVNVSGGTTTYTYNWTPGNPTGDGTASVTGLIAGTWTCTVTDANSCTATQTFNITSPTALVVTPASQTNVSCFGGSNGAASINTPTGGAGGYTYNWTPGNPTGDGTVSVTGLTAGSWTCTVTDANSCTATQTFNITAPTAIVVTPASQTNISCNGGSNGAASINTPTGGAGGYTYNWTPGNPTGDGTVSVTGLTAGTWTCTVTDANSCTATQTFNITQPTAITASISSTPTSCTANTGTATVSSVSGGAGGYTYSWAPTGGTAATATGLGAGNYTCTITDANTCSITRTVNVTTVSGPSLTAASQTNVICFGGNTGAASVNPATGGTSPYTYNWTPGNPTGDGTVSVTGLIAGTWTCTVTDAAGCTATATFNITQPPALTVSPASQTNVSCFGGNNGAASVTVSGGTGGYTYNWTPGNPTGDGTVSVTGLAAGTWTCTVTDANACTATQTFNITSPTAIVVTPASQTNILCNGITNGAASINTPTGGAGGYTYNWTPGNPLGDGTTSVTALAAGTWTCTVTDANSCTATQTFNITQPAALVVSAASQTNISCNGGSNGAASVNVSGGTTAYTYNWTPGNPTGDGTASVTGLIVGTYTCTVTDANSCIATQTFNITEPTPVILTASSQTNISCFGGSNGAASVAPAIGGTPGYTYNWTPGNPTGDGTVSVTGLTAGTWTCTVTDANSCTATRTFTITSPTALVVTPASQTNVSCFGGSNGAASINTPTGGAGGYTYNWTPGNPTGDGTVSVTGLAAGTWTCTVTDANSCTATQTFNITSPSALVVTPASQTNISCNGGSNGAASINTPTGGAGGYTYNWTPGNPTGDGTVSVTGLTAGTWTCTVTDANACTATQTFNITQPTAITASISSTTTACTANTGTATVSSVSGGAGGYTYSWAPTGGTAATATGLGAGNYTCTITDANTCSITRTVNVTTVSGPSLTAASQTNISCFGGNTGAASVNPATGGTPGYTYNWTPGNPTGDGTVSVTGLIAGSWTCTVTDAAGCTATATFNITQPPAITVNPASQTNVSCFNGSNGAASVTVTGGTPGYTYNWTPGNPTGDGTASVTGLTAGTWTCTVTDANSCVATRTFNITQPTPISVSPTLLTNVTCNGGNNGAISILVTGGTPGYSYNWTPGNPTGDGTPSVTGLTAGVWTCTITDANGCVTAPSFTILQPVILSAPATATPAVICAGQSSTLSASATGGTSPYTYNWQPINLTGPTQVVTPPVTTVYTVTVTDANNCIVSNTVLVTVNQLPVVTLSGNSSFCAGGSTLLTGTSGGSSQWYRNGVAIPLATGTTYTATQAGVYNLIKTNANGCSDSAAVGITVTVNPLPVITSSSSVAPLCNGGSNGQASVTATGIGTLTYNWLPSGGNAANANGLTAGTYTCTVTDANGCSQIQTVVVTQPAAITATTDSITNVLCNGASTGVIGITATGGTGSLSYSWSPAGGNAPVASGLTAGTYTCTITDANNCTSQQTVVVTEPSSIVTTVSSVTNASCFGTSDGSATVNATGGAGNYTYNWQPAGGNASTASGLAAGLYTVAVTDTNACTTQQTVTITEPPAFGLAVTSNPASICIGNSAILTATVQNSIGTPVITWLPNAVNADSIQVSPSVTTTYTVVVTDSSVCSDSLIYTLTVSPLPVFTLGSDTTYCSSSAPVILSGPSGAWMYSWQDGSTSQNFAASQSSVYVLTVSDSSGSCSSTDSVSVSFTPSPIVSLNDTTDCATSFTLCGPAGNYLYAWSTGATTQCIVYASQSDTLMISVTDSANGCATMDTAIVTLLTPPAVSLTVPAIVCIDDAPVNLVTTPSGGILTGPGLTGNSFNPGSVQLGIQVFSYYYIDTNGCDVTVIDSTLVDPCTGLSDNTNGAFLTVYPNPANDIVYLNTTENGYAEVINELGQTVDRIQITESNYQLKTSGYASGLYLIRYTTLSGKMANIRLALQH